MGKVSLADIPPQWIDMRFKQSALVRYNLPDILYPLRLELVGGALGDGGHLPFAQMLAGLQQRSADSKGDWQALEPALDRLACLLAADGDEPVASASGTGWWVEIGAVDLSQAIVTIQRGRTLVAAIGRRKDGRLRLAAFRPLDAKSARLVIGLAVRPHGADGTVCMRDNNWDFALDCSAATSQWYAFERGEAYLSYWEHGLGIRHDRSFNAQWYALRADAQRRPAVVARELAVAHAGSSRR